MELSLVLFLVFCKKECQAWIKSKVSELLQAECSVSQHNIWLCWQGGSLLTALFPFGRDLVSCELRAWAATALWHADHWMLASRCVIRIRIRKPSQSTPSEVNEHVCLLWDVFLSEPAVTRLEGNCLDWPLYLYVIYLEYFSICFITVLDLLEKDGISLYFWGGFPRSVITWRDIRNATSSW